MRSSRSGTPEARPTPDARPMEPRPLHEAHDGEGEGEATRSPTSHEVADDDVLFQNGMWNLEAGWVFGVDFDAVDQFVAIGELLLGKLLFESVVHLQSSSPTSPPYFSNTEFTWGTNAATNA